MLVLNKYILGATCQYHDFVYVNTSGNKQAQLYCKTRDFEIDDRIYQLNLSI